MSERSLRRRMPGLLLALAMLGALFMHAVPASAHTARQHEIEREKSVLRQKIAEADRQAKTISKDLAQSDRSRQQLEARISSLTAEIAAAESRLQEAEEALARARDELHLITTNLSEALKQMDDMQQQIAQRARETYKSGTGGYIDLLISASSLREFLTRLAFLRGVMVTDKDRMLTLESAARTLNSAKSDAEARKADITAQKEAIEQEKVRIESLKGQLAQARKGILVEIANHRQMLSKVESDKDAYLREMAKLEAESRSITALLKSRQRGQTYRAGTGAKLAWPTTGQVTSSYGYRTHPIFRDRRFHSGIDIGAPTGQAVISSESGTVVFAGVRGGYGLTVIVDHGNALATLYAHLSALSVSSGSPVSRGARVGSVGCSGYCTGPHLHYETRINGDPVDPMQFF